MDDRLKNLISSYNKEQLELKKVIDGGQGSYTPAKLLEMDREKKKEIKERFSPKIDSLIKELSTAKETTSKELIKKRYPASFNNKVAGEMEIAHSQRVMDAGDEDKILSSLKLANTIQRYDFINFTLDSLLPTNTDTVFGTKLKEVQLDIDKTLGLDIVKEKIALKTREVVIAETFLKDITTGIEAVYPFTLSEIKGMDKRIMQAQLDMVSRSMEINGIAEERSLKTVL